MAPAKAQKRRCRGSLVDASRAVLAAQLDEVEARRARITGPGDSRALHDLRIAAKRLRYSLETFALAFPPGEAQSHADHVRELQDVLGRIHDLDVLMEILSGRIARMDADALRRGIQTATGAQDETVRQHDLQALVWGDQRYPRLGLYSLIGTKADERREQYSRFLSLWTALDQSGIFRSIHDMLSRPRLGLSEVESETATIERVDTHENGRSE